MNKRFQSLYMDMAVRVSQMSRAVRLKVGCIIVKEDTVVFGWNGTPAGWDNECETKEWCSGGGWLSPEEINYGWPHCGTYEDSHGNVMEGNYRLVTRPEVLHSERNAINKLAKHHGISGDGATMFVTHAPCLECAKSIYSAGISQVYYNTEYRSFEGIDFLKKCGVGIEKIN
jgi:dCMP deaminase